MAKLSNTGHAPATIGSLSAIVCTVALGLSGCGSEQTGEFQSYGQGETPAVPTGTAKETPKKPDSAVPVNSVVGAASVAFAFSQPPVVAPVPQLADNADAVNALAVNAATPTAAPDSTDPGNSNTPAIVAKTTAATVESPRDVKILIPEREFRVAGPEDAIRITFDDIDLLKVINMDPVTADAPDHMPAWLKDLDGKRIRLRGFMYTAFMETGLKNFMVARDLQLCCFGSDAKLYDRFLVRMRKGTTTNYLHRTPFDVVGIFRINPDAYANGDLAQIYEIDDAIVIEK